MCSENEIMTTGSVGAVVAFAALTAAAPLEEASYARTEGSSLNVAVVDGDGPLLPIARYTGRKWVNTWPDLEDAEAPVPSLQRVPRSWLGKGIPLRWTVWFTTGGRAQIRVTGIERSGGCLAPATLTTMGLPNPPHTLFKHQIR
jgi:hypothetical protein